MKIQNKCVLKNLIKQQANVKTISSHKFYQSINVITRTVEPCETILEFMIYNIHLNLKTETDFFEYTSQSCEKLTEKQLEDLKIKHENFI